MHLLVDISAHGFGHLAQVAPVLAALRARRPELRLTLRSALPRERLALRLAQPFEHVALASDFGFVMDSAVDIDAVASAARYREFHADWDGRVAAEAAWLRAGGYDAVLANAAYLPLAGAAVAGLPAVGLSSLNWADLAAEVFRGEAWFAAVEAQMRAAYRSAASFLRLEPGLPMPWLERAEAIPPVARTVTPDRAHFARKLDIDESKRWLLVAMGGMDFPLDLAAWPPAGDACWVVQGSAPAGRPDMRGFDAAEPSFGDLLASCDLVLTKPGYGTFVEAACAGVAILYLERPDWAETPHFAAWLGRHARAAEVSRARVASGDLLGEVDALLRRDLPPKPQAGGAEFAAARIEALLFSRGN